MQTVQTPLAQSSQETAINVQNNTQQQANIQYQVQRQAAPDVQQLVEPSMVR